MKRVVRDVIKIVTTIYWLPEDEGFSSGESAMEGDLAANIVGQHDGAGQDKESPDWLHQHVFYTYVLIYHVIDHA